MSVESGFMLFPIIMSIFGFVVLAGVIVLVIVLIIKGNKGITNPEFAKNALIQNGFVLSDVTQNYTTTQAVSSAFLGIKNDTEIYLFLLYPNASMEFIENIYNTGEDKVLNQIMSSTPSTVTVSYVHDGNYIKYRKYKDTLVFIKCNEANSKEANEYLKQMCS